MVTVTMYVHSGKEVETYTHELERFPTYEDMLRLCEEDNIRADDFKHHRQTDTFFIGDFIRAGGKSGRITRGRRGLKFFIRTEEPVGYEDLVR